MGDVMADLAAARLKHPLLHLDSELETTRVTARDTASEWERRSLHAGGSGGRHAPQLWPMIREFWVLTKDGRLLPLRECIKPAQWDFLLRCQRQLDTRGHIRMCVLKARQLGLSTIIEAIIFALSMIFDDFKSKVISHEKDSASHLLGMTRRYWDNYVFAQFYETRYLGQSHMAWTNGSDITVATARNTRVGRSDTIHALHASEVAFWDNAETLMIGLDNSVPSFGVTAVFFESTANGVGNYFHTKCNQAMKDDGEYEFVFYPWFEDPEYTADYIPKEVREKYSLLNPLSDPEAAAEEQYLRDTFHLPDERLLWRRWHIANRCGGSLEKFHQEMPSTPHEAFITSGRNVIPLPNLLAHYQPKRGVTGHLIRHNNKIEFREHPHGWLTIFSYPSDDREWGVYLVGGDPTHAPGGDFACMQVINRRTLEQVAVYRRKINPIQFGKDMQLVGYYYNTALLAPEKEGPGYATIGCIVADNYPNVYQTTQITKMRGKVTTDVAGWSTNMNTKELAINQLVQTFSQPLVQYGASTYGIVVHDKVTILELRDYVTSEKGLGYENSDGSEYDDGVMALAIANAVHQIEPKPRAYEEVAPHELRAPSPVASLSGSGATIISGTVRPIDQVPQDSPTGPNEPTTLADLIDSWFERGRQQ